MEVLIFQLIIIGSIVGFSVSNREHGRNCAIGWTIFSFLMVGTPELMVIQLGMVWGSWYFANRAFKKKQKPKEASKPIQETPPSPKPAPDAATNITSIVHGLAHSRELQEALKAAKSELFITSGWLSDKVVNNSFCMHLSSALDRGVDVHVIYGASDRDGQHTLSDTAKRALKNMKKAAAHSKHGRLTITERSTHEKVLIVDNKYAIVGSYNWLANAHYRDKEISLKTNQKDTVTSLITLGKSKADRHEVVYGPKSD